MHAKREQDSPTELAGVCERERARVRERRRELAIDKR